MNADDKGVMKRFEGSWDIKEWSDASWHHRPSALIPPIPPIPPPLSFLSLKESLADALRNNGLTDALRDSGMFKSDSSLGSAGDKWSAGDKGQAARSPFSSRRSSPEASPPE